MNKQELIERIKGLENIFGNKTKYIQKDAVIRLISELEEPETQVPQFVADWIEECKENNIISLSGAFEYAKEEVDIWLSDWTNQETFARAWLDGYDIEGRKYIVTDGNHLYFKNYQEDIEIVILVDEQPGTMEYVKKFDTKEEAQKAADILGWKVQEVEE